MRVKKEECHLKRRREEEEAAKDKDDRQRRRTNLAATVRRVLRSISMQTVTGGRFQITQKAKTRQKEREEEQEEDTVWENSAERCEQNERNGNQRIGRERERESGMRSRGEKEGKWKEQMKKKPTCSEMRVRRDSSSLVTFMYHHDSLFFSCTFSILLFHPHLFLHHPGCLFL